MEWTVNHQRKDKTLIKASSATKALDKSLTNHLQSRKCLQSVNQAVLRGESACTRLVLRDKGVPSVGTSMQLIPY